MVPDEEGVCMLRIWGPIAVVASSLLFGAAGSASAHSRDSDVWYGRADSYRVYPAARYDRDDRRYRDDRAYRYDRDDRGYRDYRDDRRYRLQEEREERRERERWRHEEERERRDRGHERRDRYQDRWHDRYR
jgi:hypothetical protein